MKRDLEPTGIFIRVQRNGKWMSKDIADCTREEILTFLSQKPEAWKDELVVILCDKLYTMASIFSRIKEVYHGQYSHTDG